LISLYGNTYQPITEIEKLAALSRRRNSALAGKIILASNVTRPQSRLPFVRFSRLEFQLCSKQLTQPGPDKHFIEPEPVERVIVRHPGMLIP